MNWKSPWWLIGTATLLLIGLIINQVMWVFNSAEQQEAQFNKQIQMALTSIAEEVENDTAMCYSVDCCLMRDKNQSCSPLLNSDKVWARTDSMISSQLQHFDINLNYNFDFCFQKPNDKNDEAYVQNMDKVFEDSGIVLYLEFPDKSKYLRNQIGPVFISSILFIVFLSIVFALTYRYYKREKKFSQRTRDFINNMTHEFNTPLTNISLANSMISRGIESESKDKLLHYSEIIDDEKARLEKNCEDLLQMARIENDENELFETINVHEIISKVIENAKRSKISKGFTINSNLDAPNCNVLGKESLFYNTISNLVDNAIKYSDKSLEITISTSNKGGQLYIEVADNGIGIQSHHLPNIFDKFYRVAEGDEHNVKGFGLGLAYVNMVISKMKGKIKVHSSIGIGSKFNIILPLNKF